MGDHILCVFQDTEGFIWVGTFAGLHRYDGYSFRVFNREAPLYHHQNMIADNTVYAILEDRHHTLWIGTERGLSRYNPETDRFTNYYPDAANPARGPSHENIRCIYEDDQGYLWLGTYGGGLNRFNPATETFDHFKQEGDSTFLPSNLINDFYVDKNQQFWIGTEGDGLVLFNHRQDTFTYFRHHPQEPTSISSDVVNKIIEDKTGKLWVGTWGGGVCQFDPEQRIFKRYDDRPESRSLKSDVVRSLLEDSKGQLWLATFGGGLSQYDRATDSFVTYASDYENPSSLSNNILWTLFEDRHGLLWVGTYGSGLDILKPAQEGFVHYETQGSQTLSSNQISAFCEATDGRIWIGTIDGGINRLDRTTDRITPVDILPEHPMTTIRTIFEDQEENLWIGTDQGLYYYEVSRGVVKSYQHDPDNPASISRNGVYCIAQDPQENIWVGSWDTGLNRLDAAEYRKENPAEAVFQHYQHQDADSTSLSSNKVWALYSDKNGDLWCGTEKSLDRLKPDRMDFSHTGSMNVGKIIEDEAGIFWLGTYGQGIARFNPKNNELRFYNQLEHLDINLVLDMELDEQENLWMGSIDGITRFNTRTEQFTNLDLTNELKRNEYEINDMIRLSSGEFVVGGDFGVDIFDPAKVRAREDAPTVVLTDFQIANQSVPVGEWQEKVMLSKSITYTPEVNLTHHENLIAIEFAALYFSSQDQHLYAYKLEGYDTEWTYTRSDARKATYTNLPPGTYTFRVKGATREGNWSPERTLQLTVATPFWHRLSFKLLALAMFVAAMALLFTKKYQLEKNRVYWQFEAERTCRENEIVMLQYEKLHTELEHHRKELASSSLYNMHKDEELTNIRNELGSVLTKVKGSGQEHGIKKLIAAIDRNTEVANNWEHFEKNVNLLHDGFLQRFTEAYPKLTHKDLKICAFIRMNFDNKEIASMLNITPESLGVSRTRIRKKINLDRNTYLNDLIVRF